LLAPTGKGPRRVLESLLGDGDVRDFLGINRYRDVLWFSQERFDALVAGLQATAILVAGDAGEPSAEPAGAAESETAPRGGDGHGATLAAVEALARSLREAESASNYQLERLLRLLPISSVS
jgi:hypothetical protein